MQADLRRSHRSRGERYFGFGRACSSHANRTTDRYVRARQTRERTRDRDRDTASSGPALMAIEPVELTARRDGEGEGKCAC